MPEFSHILFILIEVIKITKQPLEGLHDCNPFLDETWGLGKG